MTPNRQKRSTPSRPIQREFGDWRISPGSPEEQEVLRHGSLSVWRQASMRLNQLENATSYGALWRKMQGEHEHRHNVNVTQTTDYSPAGIDTTSSGIENIHGFKKIFRLLIAILLLLPLSITMVHALAQQLYHSLPQAAAHVEFWLSDPIYFTILGIGTFSALTISRVVTPLLVYFYVLGHELTHALAALTCFGRICGMRVDVNGGYIETDKDNTYIALAPYFVPFWMLVWVLLTWLIGLFLPEGWLTAWFFGGAGFWWSFHIYWTIWVIPREQPDLLENGVTFSLLIVIIANIVGLILLLRFFGFISLRGYCQDFVICADKLRETISWLFSLCANG